VHLFIVGITYVTISDAPAVASLTLDDLTFLLTTPTPMPRSEVQEIYPSLVCASGDTYPGFNIAVCWQCTHEEIR